MTRSIALTPQWPGAVKHKAGGTHNLTQYITDTEPLPWDPLNCLLAGVLGWGAGQAHKVRGLPSLLPPQIPNNCNQKMQHSDAQAAKSFCFPRPSVCTGKKQSIFRLLSVTTMGLGLVRCLPKAGEHQQRLASCLARAPGNGSRMQPTLKPVICGIRVQKTTLT